MPIHKLPTGARRIHDLNTYLVTLVFLALLPVLAAAGYAVWKAGSAFRDTSAARLQDTARTLAGAVESEIDGTFSALDTLASLQHKFKEAGVPSAPWLADAERHLGGRLHIIEADAVPDPDTAGRIAAARAEGGGRTISNLIDPKAGLASTIELSVSLEKEDGEDGRLVLDATPQRLIQTLQQRDERLSGILVAVTDGTGRILARSHDPRRFIGKQVPDWKNLIDVGAGSGLFQAVTAEGFPIKFSFQKLDRTPGWVVVVGEPLDLFNARWRQPLVGLAIGAGVALLLAVLAASWMSRLILSPIRALARHGERIVSDGRSTAGVEVQPSGVTEFEVLRRSFIEAETVLREQVEKEKQAAEAVAMSERRYRAVAEAGALVFWNRESNGDVLSATGWEELTGQKEENALGAGWLDNVHPDDLDQVAIAWREALAAHATIDQEFRVLARNGRWSWVRARGAPIVGANGQITEWVGVLEDVDSRKQAQARIAHMAHHDALTGLGNRLLLHERMDDAVIRALQGEQSAILCIDLDRFKEVNDTLGHAAGDALLCAVTERLLLCIAPTDIVARLGGDEFAIIQKNSAQPSAASSLGSRIVEALGAPYNLNGQHVIIGASVGITIIDADSGDADRVLRNADLALYRSKEDGRGRFHFFEPDMDTRMQERRRLEMDLRRGVAAGEMELYYQPLHDLRTRELTGLEALLRWHHPERGPIPQRDFLPIAEDTGLSDAIGETVLRQACMEAARWPDHIRVAVNISAMQLAGSSLIDAVEAALCDSGIAPQRLELEISEKAILGNIEGAMATLLKLKRRGVGITMDDFGTGYSSLGYLRTFPFGKVKIDRSFIQDLGRDDESLAIVRAITGLCGSLGIITTAEGVETEEQLAILGAEACTEAQGYLFGDPYPAAQLHTLLAGRMRITR